MVQQDSKFIIIVLILVTLAIISCKNNETSHRVFSFSKTYKKEKQKAMIKEFDDSLLFCTYISELLINIDTDINYISFQKYLKDSFTLKCIDTILALNYSFGDKYKFIDIGDTVINNLHYRKIAITNRLINYMRIKNGKLFILSYNSENNRFIEHTLFDFNKKYSNGEIIFNEFPNPTVWNRLSFNKSIYLDQFNETFYFIKNTPLIQYTTIGDTIHDVITHFVFSKRFGIVGFEIDYTLNYFYKNY